MRFLVVFLIALSPLAARADEFKQRDEARHAIADAINANDAKTVAKYIGSELATSDLWLDTPSCRKQFSNAKVKAKELPAFVACMSPLGIDAKTLLVRYGPDVIVRLEFKYANDKTTLVGLRGESSKFNQDLPHVWIDAFEQHRKAGAKEVALDDKARAEVEASDAGGVIFDVCVDAKGTVSSTKLMFVAPNGPTAKAVAAAVKDWRFDPFLVRGKAATACALVTSHLPK
jgi:hypothetical protein